MIQRKDLKSNDNAAPKNTKSQKNKARKKGVRVSSTAATKKVKANSGDGLANEGTNVSYDEER